MSLEKKKGFFILKTPHDPKAHITIAPEILLYTDRNGNFFDRAGVLMLRKTAISVGVSVMYKRINFWPISEWLMLVNGTVLSPTPPRGTIPS